MTPKFKAITTDGKWVEGTYHYSADNKYHYILRREKFLDRPDNEVSLHKKEVHEVIPETVCISCYNLKDGTTVFKGDKVKVRGTKKVGIYETEIVEDTHGFTLKENKTYYKDNKCFIAIIEITGSIHDHLVKH